MSRQHHQVKIAPRNGGHMVYMFITESSGRSYGGRVIGFFNDFGLAMKKAESISTDGAVLF